LRYKENKGDLFRQLLGSVLGRLEWDDAIMFQAKVSYIEQLMT